MYTCFKRTLFRANKSYPDGLEPRFGRKTYLTTCNTEEEAVDYCTQWNAETDPVKLLLKSEFTAGAI